MKQLYGNRRRMSGRRVKDIAHLYETCSWATGEGGSSRVEEKVTW